MTQSISPMNMRTKRTAILLITIFSFLTLTGCRNSYDYDINPSYGSVKIARAPRTIPYSVALVSKNGDQLKELQQGLKESDLFSSIQCPAPSENSTNGILEVNLNHDHHNGNFIWTMTKGVLVIYSLFILDGVFDFEREYVCSCTVNLHKNGAIAKTYTASGSAVICAGLSNLNHHSDKAKDSASRALQANLVQQLIEDRAFIEKSLNPTTAAFDKE